MPDPIRLDSIAGEEPVFITEAAGGSITLGREPENTVIVDSESVSRRHGCLFEAGSQWLYRDLGSTNGSWVNGVKAELGNLRLVRDGDVVQVADFAIKVSCTMESKAEQESEVLPPVSLLVFEGDSFLSEYPLDLTQARLTVGGPDSNLPLEVEGDLANSPVIIQQHISHIDLSSDSKAPQVVVNGSVVLGNTVLKDGDIVEVCDYRIVINDPNYASSLSREDVTIGVGSSPKEVKPAEVYDRITVPEHLKNDKEDGGWESESARRKANTGRRFVFGNIDEENDATTTVAIENNSQDLVPRGGFRNQPLGKVFQRRGTRRQRRAKFLFRIQRLPLASPRGDYFSGNHRAGALTLVVELQLRAR